MTLKSVEFGDDARKRMFRGLDRLVDTVAITLGPAGRHVVIEQPGASPLVTRDGARVARELAWSDPLENAGARLFGETAREVREQVGDGTTTTLVLARALVREGNKLLAVGMNPASVVAGMRLAVAAASEDVARQARRCEAESTIAAVATVACNGDAKLGKLVAAAILKAGPDGLVTAERANTEAEELVVTTGTRIDSGLCSPAAALEDGHIHLEQPLVLLCNGTLRTHHQLLPVMEFARQNGRPILVLARDFEPGALSAMLANKAQGVLRIYAIRAPGIGEAGAELLADLSVLLGAEVLHPQGGRGDEVAQPGQLGSARHASISRNSTVVSGGGGDGARIAQTLAGIRAAIREARGELERRPLEERASRLAERAVALRVAAPTDTELDERMARCEDAIHAARAALSHGVVAGGGLSLLRAAEAARSVPVAGEEEQSGRRAVVRALEEPLRQLAENRGGPPTVVVDKVRAFAGGIGYDAASGAFRDLFEAGVIDAAKVVRVALEAAASAATVALSITCAITDAPERPPRSRAKS